MDKLTPTMLALLDYFARLDEGLDPGPYPVRAQHAGRTRAALVERGLLIRARDWRYGAPQLTDEGRAVVLARAEVEALAEDVERRAAARATVPAHYVAQAAFYAAEVPDLLGALAESLDRRQLAPAGGRCDGCGAWPGLAHEPTCSAVAA